MKKIILSILLLNAMVNFSVAQKKDVVVRDESWVSVNSVLKLNEHWGIVADLHERRNNFFAQNDFHFVRTGISYQLDKNVSFVLGYGHMWMAPSKVGYTEFANENRIYEQVQFTSAYKKINFLQRLRSEQRWKEVLVNDKHVDSSYFTQRFRYLLSTTIPVFKSKKLPSLVVADEVCLQFGKNIGYNTFDQNRLFFGIKQFITPALNCDMGYMAVFQQKDNGYTYNLNRTFRLFFYYTPKLYKHKA